MSEVETGKIFIQTSIRGKETRVRSVQPDALTPKYLKDGHVQELLKAMEQYPGASAAIIENSRRILRVISLSVSGAFRSRLKPPSEE